MDGPGHFTGSFPTDTLLFPQAGKLFQWQSASRFFRQIQENDNHSQLWFVRRRFNWQKYLHDLAGSAPESYREAAHEVANRWHETISQGPILPDYDFIAAFEISLPLLISIDGLPKHSESQRGNWNVF